MQTASKFHPTKLYIRQVEFSLNIEVQKLHVTYTLTAVLHFHSLQNLHL